MAWIEDHEMALWWLAVGRRVHREMNVIPTEDFLRMITTRPA